MINQKTFIVVIHFIMLFFAINTVSAQQKTLKGKIVNNEKHPLEFVHVTLLKNNTIYVEGMVTDSLGYFSFNVEKGSYRLIVEQFGMEYLNKVLDFNQDLDLGEISIDDAFVLESITILSRKKVLERKVDRIVYHVENSVVASGGDAIDLLVNTPGVRYYNEQLSIIGKSNLAVMVDDKLVPLVGDDLVNYLKSIQADYIKSIEIITTPPASYDAEGNSGIINIRLKKPKNNTINGNISGVYSQAKSSLGTGSASLNFQKDRLTIISSLNYSNGSVQPRQNYTITYPEYIWREESKRRNYSDIIGGRLNIEYRVNDKLNMGVLYHGTNRNPKSDVTNTAEIYNPFTLVVDSLIDTKSHIKYSNKTNNIGFYSNLILDTLGKKISFDANYLKYSSTNDTRFSTVTKTHDGDSMSNNQVSAINLSSQDLNIYTSKVDFILPYRWINLAVGAKMSFIDNHSDVNFYRETAEWSVYDKSKSDDFLYEEKIQSVYFSADKKLSDRWSIQLGLRAENTQISQYSKSEDSRHSNTYFKLFPTLYIVRNIGESDVLAMTYSKRINRPNYTNLNPYRFYSSAYNYAEGNPFLKPFYSDNIELSYMNNSFYTSLSYSYTQDGIDQITYVDPSTQVQRVFPDNVYSRDMVSYFFGYNFDKWPWLFSDLQLASNYSNLRSKVSSTLKNYNMSFVVNNSFTFGKEGRLIGQLNFMYQSPSLAGSYELSDYYNVDAGLRYTIMNKKIQVALMFFDVFKSQKLTFKQTVNGIPQSNFDYRDTQKIRFSISYNFGKLIKTAAKTSSNKEESERIN